MMKPIALLVLMSLLSGSLMASIPAQESEPQEAPRAPQPEPEPDPPVMEPRPDYQLERQQREEERRRAYEADRQNRERTQQMLRALGLDDTRAEQRTVRPAAVQPFFAPVMRHDPEFDLRSIPLEDWLKAR